MFSLVEQEGKEVGGGGELGRWEEGREKGKAGKGGWEEARVSA